MKVVFAYPRLQAGAALARLAEVKEQVRKDPSKLGELAMFEHPLATPVPTGAVIAGAAVIERLRQQVISHLAGWLGAPIPRKSAADFDRQLGAVLHAEARMVPADAAHDDTWNFLSAVVFPDIVWARFPDLPEDRFLGRPRNTLRRVWFRQEVLGDLMTSSGPAGLGEDELVGLLERSSLARNRKLVRVAARHVLTYDGKSPRSEWARDFYKVLTYHTGPLLIDVLSDAELEGLVRAAAQGRIWDGERLSRAGDVECPTEHGEAREESVAPSGKDSGDLVRSFHGAMLQLIAGVRREVDYNPTQLARMVNEVGGVAAAQRIAGSAELSEGFVVLWEKHRLDLSVEHLVLDPEYQGLFTPDLLEVARTKLAQAGWFG